MLIARQKLCSYVAMGHTPRTMTSSSIINSTPLSVNWNSARSFPLSHSLSLSLFLVKKDTGHCLLSLISCWFKNLFAYFYGSSSLQKSRFYTCKTTNFGSKITHNVQPVQLLFYQCLYSHTAFTCQTVRFCICHICLPYGSTIPNWISNTLTVAILQPQ